MPNRFRFALAHVCVTNCAISPCGEFVVLSTNFGSLIVIPIDCFKSTNVDESKLKTYYISNPSNIYSLLTKSKYLFLGVKGAVLVLEWSKLLRSCLDFTSIFIDRHSSSYETTNVRLSFAFIC